MGQVIIRKLDDAVIAAHKRRAAARGVSLEQQLRDVLAEAAKPSRERLIADLRRIRAMTPKVSSGEPSSTTITSNGPPIGSRTESSSR